MFTALLPVVYLTAAFANNNGGTAEYPAKNPRFALADLFQISQPILQGGR